MENRDLGPSLEIERDLDFFLAISIVILNLVVQAQLASGVQSLDHAMARGVRWMLNRVQHDAEGTHRLN